MAAGPEKVKDWPWSTQPRSIQSPDYHGWSPSRPTATNLAGAMMASSPFGGPQTQADEVVKDSSSTGTATTGHDAHEQAAAGGGGGRRSLLGNINLFIKK